MKYLNQIICGDTIKIMKDIPNESIDLIVTSPPYNCGINYDCWNDNLKWKDYLSWCEEWLIEFKRILKIDGRFCINILLDMGIENNKKRVSPFAEFYKMINKVGMKPNGFPLWMDSHKVKYTAWGSWLSASAPYIYTPYEVILIGYNSIWKKRNVGKNTINKEKFIMGCSGLWKIRTQTKELTKANFHTDLSDLCIELLSYENDVILDPFCGAGTTCFSAKKLKRNYIGIDISKKYCEISRQRLQSICGLRKFMEK